MCPRSAAGIKRLKAIFREHNGLIIASPFKAKISNAKQLRIHTMLVIGGRDLEAGAVRVRLHHGGPPSAKPKVEVVADILVSIKERRE